MTLALGDAGKLDDQPADETYGGVVARISNPLGSQACRDFVPSCDFAFRFAFEDGYELFLFFRNLEGYLSE